MAAFDAIMQCNLGHAGLILTGYQKSSEGVYDESGVRTATRVSFRCSGEIESASVAAHASALAGWEAIFRNKDGADFSITAGGILKEQLLAADCSEGPTYKSDYDGPAGALTQGVSFTVSGTVPAAVTAGVIEESQKVKTAVNVEGLSATNTSGTIRTMGGTSAGEYFIDTVLPAATIAGTQRSYDYETNATDTACTYTINQVALLTAYPVSGDSAVLDGERTIATRYDGHNRKITSYNYSYVGPYAQTYVENMHATLRAAGGLLSASISHTVHKTQSCTGQFEVLARRNTGTSILEFSESLALQRSGPLLAEIATAGTTPLLVRQPQRCFVYTQQGRAVGLGGYPAAATPLLSVNYLLDESTRMSRSGDDYVREWTYTFMYVASQSGLVPTPPPY